MRGFDIMTVDEARKRLSRLKPGQSLTYYRGDLARDRERLTPDGQALSKLADFMLQQGSPNHFVIGEHVVGGQDCGHLAQRRVGKGAFEYLITKK